MLSFTTPIPAQATMANTPRIGVRSDTPANLRIDLIDLLYNTAFAQKCYIGVTECSFALSPVVERTLFYHPTVSNTGFVPFTDRYLRLKITARDTSSPDAVIASSEMRCYASDSTVGNRPQFCTTQPRQRVIREGECDEVMVTTPRATQLLLTARSRRSTVTRTYTCSGAGLFFFRLNMEQFPDTDTLSLDLGDGEKITYTVTAPLTECCRVAWRSRTGTMEHYTFPVVKSATVVGTPLSSPQPFRTSAHTHTLIRLVSAYESREMLDALSELLHAPQVWVVDRHRYRAVKVVSEQALVHRYGVLSHMEIDIIPQKTDPVWI